MVFISLMFLYPILKLILYWYLDLPWFGFDFDLALDIIQMITWVPVFAWFIITKFPYIDWETWFPDQSTNITAYIAEIEA